MPQTKPQVTSTSVTNIQIIGDNILYNNGIIKAFYLLPTTNYATASMDGVLRSITELTNLLGGLASQRPEITFTIERVEKLIRAKDVKANLLESIKIYRDEYELPPEFSANIRDDIQSYSLLAVDIQQSEMADVEDLSLLGTAKELLKSMIAGMTGLGNLKMDPQKILDIEKNIFMAIRHKCTRASRELVFYNYVSKVFPCYEISYDALSFINENNFERIMGAVTQTVTDNFGYFEMHNDGIDLFGLPQQTTYGCMLDIKSFPRKIASANFPMDYPGCVTTIKTMKKDDAALKLKRTRSSDRYEANQAEEFGAEEEQMEELETSIAIATHALSEIERGETMCQFSCNILVTGLDRDELKQKIARINSDCKDRDILVSKSLTQAVDFLDNYLNMKPRKYDHFSSLQFPLSFQQNNGSIVGDAGTSVFSPSIGEDL